MKTEKTNNMDILKVKDNMIIYSYRNGLKTSLHSDLVALVYNKPNIWLIFKDGSYWIHLKRGLEYKISERRKKAVREAFLLYANPNKV